MATAIQWRRGTTSQHSSFTGLAGEITVDTDLNTVIVHDGSTAGGHRIAKYTEVTSAAAGDISSVVAGAGLTGGATTGDATINVVGGNGITVSADAIITDDTYIKALFSAGGDLSYSDGVFSFTNDAGDIESVVAGNGLSGGATSGAATLTLDTSSSTFTTGVQTFLAGGTLAGHIIPTTDITYDLGSSSKQWRDVYVGPGSLYINGQQVLQDNSGTIQVSADSNQNVGIVTTGSGDIEFNASGTGVINFQSDITVDAGQTLTGTGGLTLASNINLNSNSINNLPAPAQAADATNKTYVDGASYLTGGTGITNSSGTLAIDATVVTTTGTQTISGDKTFSGTTTVSGTLASTGGTITIADNLMLLNADATGTPSEDVGIIVERGDSTNVQLKWIESEDAWSFTNNGSTYQALVGLNDFSATDSGGDGSFTYSNGVFTYTGPSASETRAHFSASTGIAISNGAISTTITQYTDSDAQGAITVTDAGGDGSLAYSGGTITYTGPSQAEVEARIDAHLTGGSGVDYSAGAVSVDSSVVRTSGTQTVGGAKTFSDDLILSGNLTVNGTQTIVNTETLTVDDNVIILNNNEAGTPSEDAGIEVERGTSTNTYLHWKEGSDTWVFNDGSSTYTMARTTADLTENTNLYYTNARADARVAAATGGNLDLSSKDTGDLSEGSNLYFTNARADARIAAADTDDVDEGSTNLYYTDARARAAISEGSTELAYNSTTGVLTFTQGSTSGVAEGSNLYYTDARADARIAAASTSDLSEGTNLYHTTERVQDIAGGMFSSNTESGITATYQDADGTIDLAVSLSSFDTDNLSEGSSNLYFTNTRADTRIALQTGSNLNLAGVDTGDLAEGSNQYHTTARARAAISATGDIAYNSTTGVISFTNDAGDIEGVTAGTGLSGGGTSGTVSLAVSPSYVKGLFSGGTGITYNDGEISLTDTGYVTGVTAGTGLSGGGTSGTVTLNVSGLTTAELAAGSLQLGSEAFVDSDSVLMTAAAVQDKILSYGYATQTGDITAVAAGNGLTGGGTSGGLTLNIGAGTGIDVAADSISVDMGDFTTANLAESGNLYFTNARADARVSAIVTNSFVDALNVDADTLDGISSASFMRSDANDSHSGTITPSSNNAINLGSSGLKYANVYATTFQGTATSAQYADLAEKYESDAELEAGTVVMFGGDKEVTSCDSENCHAVAGVISTDPAYMMNAGSEGQFVALTGRVPTKVTGPVAKGDLMVSAGNGMAMANNDAQAGRIIGKAVGSSEGGEAVIEVLVNLM